MKRRPFVFITCALTPRSETKNHAVEYLENVREAARLGATLIKNGYSVYCPANDFPYWLVEEGPTAADIYDADLGVILCADAVFALWGFQKSHNCQREIQVAEQHQIPVFHSIEGLERWRQDVWETKSR